MRQLIKPIGALCARLCLAIVVLAVMSWGQTVTDMTLETNQTATGQKQFSLGSQHGPVTFANLTVTPAQSNGTLVYVSDGSQTNPCTGGGTGAFAQRVNGAWNCSGGIIPTGVAVGSQLVSNGVNLGPIYQTKPCLDSRDYASIQAAITAAGANNCVNIVPGTYTVSSTLTILNNNVRVSGYGATLSCTMTATDCMQTGDVSGVTSYRGIVVEGLTFQPGAQSTNPAIHDNGQGTVLRNLAWLVNGSNYFTNAIQVDNDQAFTADNPAATGVGGTLMRCDATVCSSFLINPSGANNAAVGWIHNANLTMNCGGNSIDWQGGNDLHIESSVLQGYSQFALRFNTTASGADGRVVLNKVHNEAGSCSNPLGNVGRAGYILENNAQLEADLSQLGGKEPPFVFNGAGGAATYDYYVQVVDGSGNTSAPLFAGYVTAANATIDGTHTVSVVFPQIPNATTCNLFRLTTTGRAFDFPLGTSSAIQVATGITCANGVNSFTDNITAPTSVTIDSRSTYFPDLPYWPGAIVLGGGNSTAPAQVSRYFGPPPSGDGAIVPVALGSGNEFYGFVTYKPGLFNSATSVHTQGLSDGNGYGIIIPGGQERALLLPNIANFRGITNPLTGVLNLSNRNYSSPFPTDVITVVDGQYQASLGAQSHRHTALAGDLALCMDGSAGLCLRGTTSVSNYINTLPDGSNWKERLTSALKSFTVPVTTTAYQSNTNCAGVGTAANPSVASCTAAPAGAFSCATNASGGSCQVNTTIVTANSQIFIQPTVSEGTRLGVTCATAANVTAVPTVLLLSKSAGSNFIINAPTFTTNPACFDYFIVN